MTTIGWHCYEPGLQNPGALTSAGGAKWTSFLFKKLKDEGHTVVWLGDGLAPENTIQGKVKDCQVLVLPWRWSMPDYPERERAYSRQFSILDTAEMYHIPVLVHDEDYKISDADAKFLKRIKAKIARPELYPQRGVISLIFPNPYIGPAAQLPLPGMPKIDLTYVGNNYERYEQAKTFIQKFSFKYRVAMYGNWLEQSANRETPERVHTDFPNVYFGGRLAQQKVIDVLQKSVTTIHLFKPEYEHAGFVTIRWAEANAAGCPAFVPSTFHLPMGIASKLRQCGFLVNSADDMIRSFDSMDQDRLEQARYIFSDFVSKYMSADRWLEVITNVKMGKL